MRYRLGGEFCPPPFEPDEDVALEPVVNPVGKRLEKEVVEGAGVGKRGLDVVTAKPGRVEEGFRVVMVFASSATRNSVRRER